MTFGRFAAHTLLAVAIASNTNLAHAQPVPTLTAPKPVSLQRGESVTLTLPGAALAGASSIVVTKDAGLSATLAKSDKADAEAKLTIIASPDAAPGVREVRLVSPSGVSNPVQVWVEQFPIVEDTAPNTDPTKAQPIPIPAVITGNIDAPGDSDCYRFTAAKGQVLIFNVIANRLRGGGSQLDGNLIVYDAGSGRELASNNDTFGADPFLAFTVPAHGEYVVELRDLQYRGATDNFNYRIEAGQIPFVQSISPMSARRGQVVEIKATGFNLDAGGSDTIRLDLTNVPAGRLPIRVKTPLGLSNELPFEVTELPQVAEAEPNDDARGATLVSPGSDISGVIGKPNDVDSFRFKLDKPARILVDSFARRIGSPLDALLTLYDASGNAIATNDDAAGADARLGRDLAAGEYVLSIRDLGYAGGPRYAYRISLAPTLAAPDAPPQNFTLSFQPDAPRINRGGHAKLWCDVARMNFPADVSIAVEGLPPGVSVSSPAIFPAVTSGILMLNAAADAPLGTYPITIKAVAPLNGEVVTREGQPASGSRVVQQAYLTVLDPAPFAVQPQATLPPERVQQLTAEIAALTAKVLNPSPEVDARQAEWERKVLADPGWIVLDPVGLGSAAQAGLVKQPDGSILAGPGRRPTDTYTITAPATAKGIVAVRLEVLPDPSLGGGGPGRAGNGNFVLNEISATIAPQADPARKQPLKFAKAVASFSQGAYDVAGAIDDKPETGWAIAPEMGKAHTATFLTTEPVSDGAPSVLTFSLNQQYGANHVIGRFRLSVSSDPKAVDATPVPEAVLANVRVPADRRTPQQKASLAVYYRTIDPMLAPDVTRLITLYALVGPQSDIARLDAATKAQTPDLDAEQAKWEQAMLTGRAWLPLEPTEFRSAAGASFAKEPDNGLFVFGDAPPGDTYTVTAPTTLKNITGIRIEALPDARLPNNGPGRSSSGNFILSSVKVTVAPTATPATPQPVEIASASASFEQDKYPVAAALDDKPETGWAIGPAQGRPATAEFFFNTPGAADGGSILTITLDQQASAIPQHTLGRFRISATTAPNADAAASLPQHILTILKTPAASRTPEQKNEIAAYHRRNAKSLQPSRQRLTELRAAAPAYPPVVQRGKAGFIPVAITRGAGLPTGDVTVTLEGFTLGRDAEGPLPIARSLKVAPATIAGTNTIGALTFTVEGNAEQGTRLVVLRAEAKVGDDTIVQYSPAFPLTVN